MFTRSMGRYVSEEDVTDMQSKFEKNRFFIIHGGQVVLQHKTSSIKKEMLAMNPLKTMVISIQHCEYKKIADCRVDYQEILADRIAPKIKALQQWLLQNGNPKTVKSIKEIEEMYFKDGDTSDNEDPIRLTSEAVLVQVVKRNYRETEKMDVFQVTDDVNSLELKVCGETTKAYVEEELDLGKWLVMTNIWMVKVKPGSEGDYEARGTVGYQLMIMMSRDDDDMFPDIIDVTENVKGEGYAPQQKITQTHSSPRLEADGPVLRKQMRLCEEGDIKKNLIRLIPEEFQHDAPSDRFLSKAVSILGQNWEMLGYELGLKDELIQKCKLNHPNNVAQQMMEMLKKWRKKKKLDPSIKKLVQAMVQIAEDHGYIDRDNIERILLKFDFQS